MHIPSTISTAIGVFVFPLSIYGSLRMRMRAFLLISHDQLTYFSPCLKNRYLERGCVVMGKVESGTLRLDDEVAIAPTKKKAKVDAIYVGDDKVRSAKVQGLGYANPPNPS